jgi:DnaJ-class molecular chaperone
MKCKTCKGKGYMEIEFKNSVSEKPRRIKEECESCNGSGKVNPKRRNKDKLDWSSEY